ncbi:hypothetical protein QFC22_005742 [Naganishia vaughanmartiniae]|uniref:Uncharacterized protein n=1 Tax=Naganishia vaughanmartiniae TaxID=1424756 RepID=A0ACC2WSK0_9TREE|nr:hypothetical protein QFC22_005742 [Naganishia vaughanmartiniae]
MGTFTDNPPKPKVPHLKSTRWLLAAAAYLAIGSTVLLWLCTFSTPHIKSLYYLKVKEESENVSFGTFGYCRSKTGACHENTSGYRHVLTTGSDLPGSSVVVNPIAAGITTVTMVFLIYSLIRKRAAGFVFFMTLFATTLTVISYILVLATFVGGHDRAKKHGLRPSYGAAMWLHLVATLWMLLVSTLAGLAWFRHRRAVREATALADATHLKVPRESHDNSYANAVQTA